MAMLSRRWRRELARGHPSHGLPDRVLRDLRGVPGGAVVSAHLQTCHGIVGGGTASLNLDLGKLIHISAHSYADDRMVEVAFSHGRLRMHRDEFANLLRRGPEALIQDKDYCAQCSGALVDLEGESA